MSSMSNLEADNRRLRVELQQLKQELEHKNNLILSLEAQVSKLHVSNGERRSPTKISTPGLPPKPPNCRGNFETVESRPPSDPFTSTSTRLEDPPGDEPGESRSFSLQSLSRSMVDSQQQHQRLEAKDSPPILNRQDILESGIGTQLEGSILEEEEDSEEFKSRRILQSAKGAIKALPRELSIFNSDDDDVTKYSIDDGMPTYDLGKTEMRDAYNARGLYSGTVSRKEQMPHGRGRMEYHYQGRCYDGEWHLGHWHGVGIIKNANGDVYDGQVKNDLKEGEGKLVYADGRIFQGKFNQDDAIKGILIFPDGAKYVGELHNGARHGFGVYNFTDGSQYEGESVMNTFEGKGKMTWTDGGWYEGGWSQGKIHGYGMEIRSNGSLRHKGQWSKGVPIRL